MIKINMNLEKLSDFLDQWNVTLEAQPDETRTGVIARVRWKENPCLLKISSKESDERTGCVLLHYDSYGAVRVFRSENQGTLMERATPGTHLSTLVEKGKDNQATHILCDVIEKLHQKDRFKGTYKTIEDLGSGFERYLSLGENLLPRDLVERAKSLYFDLASSQSTSILLHGDLHHDNVLYDEARGWLAIDPKGYVGEPAYEVGALLRNPYHLSNILQDPERFKKRVDIICERLGFDRERVMGWGFCQAVLAALWSVEDGESPFWGIDAAHAMEKALGS